MRSGTVDGSAGFTLNIVLCMKCHKNSHLAIKVNLSPFVLLRLCILAKTRRLVISSLAGEVRVVKIKHNFQDT